MVDQQIVGRNITIYFQINTKNQSFIQMHLYLKNTAHITHNAFFLLLYDKDLAYIDPFDPRLSIMLKQKVTRECMYNPWYFLRECVRIPAQGGGVSSGMSYKLHRGNLALNYCMLMNYNVFAEFPRQHGKTIAVVCMLLWDFLFGTRNSEIAFLNKKLDDSKDNLQRLKDIRKLLPDYLRMDAEYSTSFNGRKIKSKNSTETLSNPYANNKIRTLPAARNKANANSLGRGCTQPLQWYDEYAFILHNKIIYLSATPAFSTASRNAREHHSPYGIIITTTPGILTTDEGKEAFNKKENATQFSERWYDMKKSDLDDLIAKNEDSEFVHVIYSYKELGSTDEWFAKMVKIMEKDWDAIRREVLLEWAEKPANSPFSQEDLAIVRRFINDNPTEFMLNGYIFNIYSKLPYGHVPIIGVDVSGGLNRDSSTITVIDASTTKVICDFNCNYISQHELAKLIELLVTKYFKNAVVNIERNGGFGQSVISDLKKTRVRQNLYYEYKDTVIEEKYNGNTINRRRQKTKVYGFNETGKSREQLMEILRIRMEYHKDKFISKIIFNELGQLEITRTGKIDHCANGHDDQIFSYLLALYVWYEGQDLKENWNIDRSSLPTDVDKIDEIMDFGQQDVNIVSDLNTVVNPSNSIVMERVKKNIETLKRSQTKDEYDFMMEQKQKDNECLKRILQTEPGRQAYCNKYHMDVNEVRMENENSKTTLPQSIFEDFYK